MKNLCTCEIEGDCHCQEPRPLLADLIIALAVAVGVLWALVGVWRVME